MRVLTFSLGFGPKLLKFRRGDTEYCVSAIPLGGYVKMAGENPEDARTGASDEFLSKSKWQRFQVLVMGPVMNIALALIVMAFVLYYNGADVPAFAQEPVVVGSVEPDSPAAKAGIQPGDRITEVAGVRVDNWEDFGMETVTKANRPTKLTIITRGEDDRPGDRPGRPRQVRRRCHRREADRAAADRRRAAGRTGAGVGPARRRRHPRGQRTAAGRDVDRAGQHDAELERHRDHPAPAKANR